MAPAWPARFDRAETRFDRAEKRQDGFDRMKSSRQTTIGAQVSLSGIGVHSGETAVVTLGPADTNAGYLFVRTGLPGADREIRARVGAVTATEFATVLGDASGPLISTAEHVLAALRGMGVDNATIEVDGPEIPILDGSAAPLTEAIAKAGVVMQSAPRRYIEVLKPVSASVGQSFGEIAPYARGFQVDVEIDFDNPVIGRQRFVFDLEPELFRREIARARTFGCMSDVARLWSGGYARGASLENAVVYDETRILNPEGLRYADEFVRHKALDAIGDFALAGLPLLGRFRSLRGGHRLNHAVLSALIADRAAWRVVEEAPAVRARGHAGVVVGQVVPVYGPDVS